MRVLIDLTHPAQVHFFKHPIRELREAGNEVMVTSRDKDVELQLLDTLAIEHICLSRSRRGLAGLALELLERNARMLSVARRFRPHVMAARMGISVGLPGTMLRVPRVVFEDTEHARLQASLSLPFATRIVTGLGYERDFGARQIRFRGFPVLSYLAPDRFRPDPLILGDHGIDVERPFIVLRTVAWSAAHDIGVERSGPDDLRAAVIRLGGHGRVIISAEGPLPNDLEPLRNPVPVEQVHHLLAHARLFIGESGTMAAEAAVLGTPSVFCNPLRTGYLRSLEGLGLVVLEDRLSDGIDKAENLLLRDDLLSDWKTKRDAMLSQCEDVVGAMVEAIRGAANSPRAAS
ncbi:MAG TPA: DUF354 domain-containing protein [Thermoanaerobaculia bacterium]|nr:DUF354 domain-containing protein [Thermoanaerobaculia bacterium]